MATCTGNNYVQTIDRSECIGNSLVKINNNFKALDKEACRLSNIISSTGGLTVADSPTIDLTYSSVTNTLSANITGKVPNVNGGAGNLSGLLKASSGVVSVAIPGGDYMTPGATAGGDLNGTYPSPSVAKIQGVSVSTAAPSNGQVLTYDGSTSTWTASAALPPGSAQQILTYNGSTSTWVASAAPASGLLASNFTGSNQSLAANGYQKMPGGLIIQWGSTYIGDIAGDGAATINFTIPFSNACFQVIPSLKAPGGANIQDCVVNIVGTPSTTQFTAYIQEWNGVYQTLTVTWMAFGW